MDSNVDDVTVEHNRAKYRYEARVGDHLAIAEYRRQGETITFTHTEVPEAIEGRGIASRLAHAALEEARDQGLAVIPSSPFFATYIRRHPEYAPLVSPKYQAPARAS